MSVAYPQLVLFGDSLIEHSLVTHEGYNFHGELQTLCTRRLDVVNRGLSGWTTRNAVKYLPKVFAEQSASSPKMRYLVVLLGANDAVLPLPTTSQHVPIDEYKENLTKIVNYPPVTAHKPKVLLVTPPPVDEIKLAREDVKGGHPSATRKSAVTASYAEKAREVARENPDVVTVDLWQAIMDKAISMTPEDYQPGGPWLGSPENGKQGGLDELLPDGLHMSGEAYKVLFGELKKHIGSEWAESTLENRVGFVLPDWNVLNPLPKA